MKTRATIICRRNGRILLVAREPSRWSLPGGKPKPRESLAKAARRELEEETALADLDVVFLFQRDGRNTMHHVFGVDVPTSHQPQPSNEIALCRWIYPSQLADFPTSAATRIIIKQYLSDGHHHIVAPKTAR